MFPSQPKSAKFPCRNFIKSLRPEKLPVRVTHTEEKTPTPTATFLKDSFTLSSLTDLPKYIKNGIANTPEIINPVLKKIPPLKSPKTLIEYFHHIYSGVVINAIVSPTNPTIKAANPNM